MAEGGINDGTQEKPTAAASDAPTPVQFLETPEGRKLAYVKVPGTCPGVVFIHGLNSTMSGEKALALEKYCRQRGCSYVRFELSGHGQSSGDFKTSNLTTWLEDLEAVFTSLTEGRQVIVGSSIGGWLMFLYTMRNPDRVSGLVGVACAPDLTQGIWRGLDKDARKEVKRTGVYKLRSPYSNEPYELTLQLIQDGDKYSVLDMPGEYICVCTFELSSVKLYFHSFNFDHAGIEYIKVPTWLFHGEKDELVSPSTSLKLMQR